MTEAAAFTVEQLNTYIRDYLAGAPLLNHVTVKGEISNLRTYSSGHLYFTLKDENSTIPATMFNGTSKLKFRPENGMKVLCTGRVSVFVRDGQYRLYADDIIPDGIGSLAIAFEQLKRKLSAEGLFDPIHKKKIPRIPFHVGIITALGGAALRDMINITKRRFPAATIYLAPATVQGPNAAKELIRSLQLLDSSKKCDVILIGRGGGSVEDLWCFNDESLARAIFYCNTPVISAVGHEIDFTICDFVADLRAPTPSAAAELAVPNMSELIKKFGNAQSLMTHSVESRIQYLAQRLSTVASRQVLKSPQFYFDDRKSELTRLEGLLSRSINTTMERKKHQLMVNSEKISTLNPLSILERGYSLALSDHGEIIKSSSQLPTGTSFSVRLADGKVSAVSKGDIYSKETASK